MDDSIYCEMTNEQLVVLAQKGDKEALTQIFIKNEKLIYYIIHKSAMHGFDWDDFVGIANLGMMKAIRSFDINKGFAFITLASRCIYNQLFMTGRYLKKVEKDYSFNSPVNSNYLTDGEITLEDVTQSDKPEPFELILKSEEVYLVREVINCLSAKHRELIKLRYFDRKTQDEVSKILNLSQSYVCRLEKEALKKMSNKINTIHVDLKKLA